MSFNILNKFYKKLGWWLVAFIWGLCLIGINTRGVWATTPEVAFYLFYVPDCYQCQAVKEDLIPRLRESHNLRVHQLDMDEMKNYIILTEFEKQYGRDDTDVPVVVIGDDLLSGEKEVHEHLEEVIKKYEQAGGVKLVPLPEVAAPKVDTADKPINGVYFFKQACTKCDRVFHDIKTVNALYPALNLKQLNIGVRKNLLLAEALGKSVGVKEEKRMTTPSIFIGQDKLIGEEINLESLQALVGKYKATGALPIRELNKAEMEATRREILTRFSSFALTTVGMAGLIDGINPCAFATIIFFVSYLSFIGHSKREILYVGISFTVAVFLTYLGIGLGLFKFTQQLSFIPKVGRMVYIGTGILALVLGAVGIKDFVRCLQGETRDVSLQLPKFLKRLIHKVIREESRMHHYVIAAFVAGFIISLLELVCTGQVYLPTIIYVTKIPGFIWNAVVYLIVYNLAFILPLVLVFLVAYFGVTSDDLSHFMRRHIAAVKLCFAILLLVLGGLLLYNV